MKKRVSEQVMEELLTDILSNQFRPGEILSERMLVEAYGCSKTTMREILAKLCQVHILRSIPRMGYEVLRVGRKEARDTMEYRRILETGYLRQHFDRITPETMARLKVCNDRCRSTEHAGDLFSHWDCNAEFHMELIRATGNIFAEWNLRYALDLQKRVCMQHLANRYETSVAAASMVNHDALLEAIAQGDVDKACRALEEDLSVFI